MASRILVRLYRKVGARGQRSKVDLVRMNTTLREEYYLESGWRRGETPDQPTARPAPLGMMTQANTVAWQVKIRVGQDHSQDQRACTH